MMRKSKNKALTLARTVMRFFTWIASLALGFSAAPVGVVVGSGVLVSTAVGMGRETTIHSVARVLTVAERMLGLLVEVDTLAERVNILRPLILDENVGTLRPDILGDGIGMFILLGTLAGVCLYL